MKAALLFLVFAVLQDPLDKRIAGLLERMLSEEIERREAAAKEMIALGEPAIEKLEKAAADTADPETASRLKAVVIQIKRNALIVKVAPPVKLVTVSAKDVPLKDFLADVCAQAGVEYLCDSPAADRTVTVEAKGEPVLQVIDRACASRGDVIATLAEGRLKVANGKYAADPAAYIEGYRIRVKKTVVTEVIEAGAAKTSIALYFEVDAQPDQKVRVFTMTPPRAAKAPGGGEVSFKSLQEAGLRMGGWIQAGVALVVDGVAVTVEGTESLDRICLIREAPAGLKRLESIKVPARFRYSVGHKQTSMQLSRGQYEKMPDIPYQVHFSGQQLYFIATDQRGMTAPLEDFIDLDALTLVGKEGKEVTVSPMAGAMRGRQYVYTSASSFQANDIPQLRMKTIDAFDREVEFELKDVKLRD
ncbi:MAG TPA: hypothetical protein VFC86_08665 [Planctomycetota bacterium]|nr:hypothetical protein [Planctomycetota bacterium]